MKRKLCPKCNPVVIDIICTILLILGLIICINNAFGYTKKEEIIYKETSKINYKVYLKDNNFYETPYLEDGMAYVATLIDKIHINYDYLLTSSTNTNLDIDYKIIAKLIIGSQNNSKIFFEKEYDLTDSIKDKMNDTNTYHINRQAIIDYNYYNDLANKFRASYAVNTISNLEVQLIVEEKNSENNNHKMNNHSVTSLTIPLSEQEINISMQERQINDVKTLLKEEKYHIKSKEFYTISIIILVLILTQIGLIIRYFIKKQHKLTKYDKYVNRLLNGYDRIIVNVKTPHNKNKYEIIRVNNFQELIDVRDNTKEHINYYIIEEHKKCEFYVTNDKDLYLYEVNANDFDRKKNA